MAAHNYNGKAKGKPRGRPIQKGQVLNPGGRPKALVEIRDLARQHSPEAFARVLTLMRECNNPHVQLAAAQEVLDRAWGKSRQDITADGSVGLLISLLARIADRREDPPPLEIAAPLVRNGSPRRDP